MSHSANMTLLTLPNELLLQVMKHLQESRDVEALQSAARTCRALREVAEMHLYAVAEFVTLAALYEFLEATRAYPQRINYVRHLKLLYSTSRYDHNQEASPPDLTSFPRLTSFVSESPECQPWSAKRTHWNKFMTSYVDAFNQASLLNDTVTTPRPLQTLESLVLHWTGTDDRFWDITPTSPIFLLPQLRSLEISSARVGQEGQTDWEADELERFRNQTRLKSLTFTECVVSVEALHAVLSFPAALEYFSLCEKFYHKQEIGDRWATEDSGAFNRAISQQAGSLKSLQIYRYSRYVEDKKTLALSLADFRALSHLQLGPYMSRSQTAPVFNYSLLTPLPPLESLRLDDYAVSMLKAPRANRILSELSLDELLANAEERSLSFTLDISLQHLPLLLRGAHLHGQDVRPVVHKLVEKLENRFQVMQEASIRSRSEQTSDERPSKCSSRLRVLTNKPRHKIPPFLHNEGPPRYVVRFDSSHPERFLSKPYTENIVSSDRDSSDDEDMDAAFREQADVDPRQVLT
ncbi:hypothetical protein M426DRAFT_254068 [Hypoxylon sp. CI-4A]|nr:hypothetical protein M426DRAFT_254068 [Hypoxylon sp. CI-4A]